MYDIQNPISYIPIGNRRDFGHTVQFDLTALADINADDWRITYMRPGESATYPVPDGDVSVTDNVLTWAISEAVTAINGAGSVVIEAYRGGEVLKHSDRIMTIIGAGHEPAGEAPDPVQDWIDDANAKLDEVDESLERTNSAEGLRVGAETSRNTAEGLRGSAETARKEAEALRVAAEAVRMGFKPMGAYNPANENKYGEWYTHEGGSYGYIWPEPSTGVPVTDTTHWQQIASVGGQDLVDAAVTAKNAAIEAKVLAEGYAAQLAAGTASPAGTYANLAAMNSGTPTAPDVTKIYITLDDGKWAYHNGSAWVAGGVYQATGLSDGQIEKIKLSPTLRDDLYQFNTVVFTPLSGYYASDGIFYANASYRSAYVPCVAGDVFSLTLHSLAALDAPIAMYYDASNALIASDVKAFGSHTDYLISIPTGAHFFAVTNRPDEGVTLTIKKLERHDDILNSKALAGTDNIGDGVITIEKLSADIQADLFEYSDVTPALENGFYDKDTGLYYANASYKSITVPCQPRDKFKISTYILGVLEMPIVIYYDADNALLSHSGAISVDTTVTDHEIEIGAGVAFITVTSNTENGSPPVAKKLQAKPILTVVKPLNGLTCIVLGDSISATASRWRTQFMAKTGMTETACYAVAGAHLTDYADTVLDGVTFADHGNTICNQVQAILNTPPAAPDIIIISAGTNDNPLYSEISGDVTQFVDGDNEYIDIDTVDRTRFDGAMRWQVEKLYTVYPNAVIFFATPIQAAQELRSTWNILLKADYMNKVAKFLSTPVIDAAYKSRIYGRYETNGVDGKYLVDGLHPNAAGGIVLGNCYASEVIGYMEFARQYGD